jgi:hypothetical protein
MHQDFKELLSAFNAGQVRYLIVGGYAVSFHAQPRATKGDGRYHGVEFEEAWRRRVDVRIDDALRESADRAQDAEPRDLPGSPDKGVDDDLDWKLLSEVRTPTLSQVGCG